MPCVRKKSALIPAGNSNFAKCITGHSGRIDCPHWTDSATKIAPALHRSKNIFKCIFHEINFHSDSVVFAEWTRICGNTFNIFRCITDMSRYNNFIIIRFHKHLHNAFSIYISKDHLPHRDMRHKVAASLLHIFHFYRMFPQESVEELPYHPCLRSLKHFLRRYQGHTCYQE